MALSANLKACPETKAIEAEAAAERQRRYRERRAGLLAGLGLTGWLAWNRLSEGEIVAAVGVALVGALLVSPGLMRLTMSLSRYPIAAIGAIVMVFRGR